MLGSTLIVMAWTGVYFSRQPRATDDNDVGFQNDTNSLYFYESASNDANETVSVDIDKRDKVKEVRIKKCLYQWLL